MHLSKILSQSAERFGSCPFEVSQETSGACHVLTYNAALKVSKRHQQWLERSILLSKKNPRQLFNNTVVAYLSANSTDFLLSLLASMNLALALPVLLNTRWTSVEMALALASRKDETTSANTLLLFGPGFQKVADQVKTRSNHDVVVMALPNFSQHALIVDDGSFAMKASRDLTEITSNVDMQYRDAWIEKTIQRETLNTASRDSEDAVIVFTSGTSSGGSKGVRLSHKALWIQAMSKLHSACHCTHETKMLATTVPLFHVGGLSSVLAIMLACGSWIFPRQEHKGFDPVSVLNSLSDSNLVCVPNTLVVVPAMLQSIFASIPRDSKRTFDEVRLILIGGQSASSQTLDRIAKIFPRARVVQTYACTEAASSLTFLQVVDSSSKTPNVPQSGDQAPPGDCVGVPPKHVDLCIFDANQKNKVLIPMKPYQVGVIATRGFHVMNGYWTRNDGRGRHDDVLPRNRWFLTNDLGYLDAYGHLYFCGRVKDVIRTGGETVWASEVERVVLQHDNVEECAVFALKDGRFGEAVSVAIIANTTLSTKELRSFCAQHGLAGYKRPRNVFFVTELPRNSSGKVLKHVLVERFSSITPIQSKL